MPETDHFHHSYFVAMKALYNKRMFYSIRKHSKVCWQWMKSDPHAYLACRNWSQTKCYFFLVNSVGSCKMLDRYLGTLSIRTCTYAMKHMCMRTGDWHRRDGLGTRCTEVFYVNLFFLIPSVKKGWPFRGVGVGAWQFEFHFNKHRGIWWKKHLLYFHI